MDFEHNDYLENIIKRYLNKNITIDKTKVFKLNQCLDKNLEEGLSVMGDNILMFMIDEIKLLKKDYIIITNPYTDLEDLDLDKMSFHYLMWYLEFIFIDRRVKDKLIIEVPKKNVGYWIGEKGAKVRHIAKKISKLLNRKIYVKIVGV